MFIESLENRQMFSATIETDTPPPQSVEPVVNVTLQQPVTETSAFKTVGLGMRKSAGNQASGVMYL
jgi:hypothetical protein